MSKKVVVEACEKNTPKNSPLPAPWYLVINKAVGLIIP